MTTGMAQPLMRASDPAAAAARALQEMSWGRLLSRVEPMLAPQRLVRPSREMAWLVSICLVMSSSTSESFTSWANSQMESRVSRERSASLFSEDVAWAWALTPAATVGSPSRVSSTTLVWRSSMQATAVWPAPSQVTRT